MTKKHSHFQSSLGRAKGHGSAKHAVGHWWFQRVTAVALLVLLPWFAVSLLMVLKSSDLVQVSHWFASPLNALGMITMLVALFWHAKLGFQVVVEDYVKCPYSKYSLLLANNFIAITCAILAIICVVRLHLVEFGVSEVVMP